jgi:RNA recognition motif-containing protein
MTALLIIDGLSGRVTADRLKMAFAVYGEVLWARIVTDHYGRSLGFGHVQMDSPEAAQAAQKALDGSMLKDDRIRVERAAALGLTFQSSSSVPYDYFPVAPDPSQ